MEDVLLALLWSVADLLFEVLSQVLLEAIVALIDRSIRNVTEESNAIHPMLAALGYFLLGLVFAIPTVRFYPHPIFRPSTFHGISLVISPLVTGLVMSQIGAALRRNGKQAVQIESFGYGIERYLGCRQIQKEPMNDRFGCTFSRALDFVGKAGYQQLGLNFHLARHSGVLLRPMTGIR